MDNTCKHGITCYNVCMDSKESAQQSIKDCNVPLTSMTGQNNLQENLPREMEIQHTLKIDPQAFAKIQSGSEDVVKLLGIFPEEIWETIIDHLNDPIDFESMLVSTTFFENIVESRKVLYLFPKVWEILAVKYELTSEKDSSYNHAIMDNDPATRAWLHKPVIGTCSDCGGERCVQWFSGILNMRYVCRTWNEAIDDYLQKIPLTRRFQNIQHRFRHTSHDYFSDWNTNSKRFIPHFSQTHCGLGRGARSPFVSRAVVFELNFTIEAAPKYQRFLDEITQLLTEFGRHVWHCSIMAYGTGNTSTAFYFKIKELLSFMPNLKTLELDYSLPPTRRTLSDGLGIVFTPQQVSQMGSVISQNTLPRMNQLAHLRIYNFTPVPIVNNIIGSIGSVSLLEWNVPREHVIENLYLANVRQLSVHFCSLMDFQIFFLSAEQCQVEKLTVDLEPEMFIDWREVFNVIVTSVRTETLTDFTIDLPKARQDDDMEHTANENKFLRLKLPCVKHLKLKFYNFSSLDFILPMRETLETLDVTINVCGRDEEMAKKLHEAAGKDQIINCIGYFQRPLESNIWKIFKKLKRFEFSSFAGPEIDPEGHWTAHWSHSRRRWERQQQRNQNSEKVA